MKSILAAAPPNKTAVNRCGDFYTRAQPSDSSAAEDLSDPPPQARRARRIGGHR
jgi:hypothetical protein